MRSPDINRCKPLPQNPCLPVPTSRVSEKATSPSQGFALPVIPRSSYLQSVWLSTHFLQESMHVQASPTKNRQNHLSMLMAFPPFSHCQASEGRPRLLRGRPRLLKGRPRLLGGRPTLPRGRPQGLHPHHLFHLPCNSPQRSPNNGQGLLVTPTLQMVKSIRQS